MKKIVLLLVLICSYFLSDAQIIYRSADYLFKNRVSVGAQSETATPATVWFRIGDSASNKGLLLPTAQQRDSVNSGGSMYQGTMIWDLFESKPYWWNGSEWVTYENQGDTTYISNGASTTADSLVVPISESELLIKSFKVTTGTGLIPANITDSTFGIDIDTAALGPIVRLMAGTFSAELQNVGGQDELAVEGTNQVRTIFGTGGIAIATTDTTMAIDGTGASIPPNIFNLPSNLYNSKFIVPMTGILKINNSYVLNDPIQWDFINTSNHGTISMDSVYGYSGGLRVRYPKTKNIYTLLIAPDEAFAGADITVGASVGLDSASINAYRTLKAGVRLTGAGTNTWTVTGSTTNVIVDTFNRGTGVTRITRYTNTPGTYNSDGLALSTYASRFAAPQYWGLNDSIKFITRTAGGGGFQEGFKLHYKDFNPVIAVLPTTDDNVYLDLGVFPVSFQLNTWNATNQFMGSSYNFWCIGWFEAYITATPKLVGSNVMEWQDYTGAASYKLYRSTGKYTARTLLYSGTDMNYTDATAVSGTFYYYHLIPVVGGIDQDVNIYFTCTTL